MIKWLKEYPEIFTYVHEISNQSWHTNRETPCISIHSFSVDEEATIVGTSQSSDWNGYLASKLIDGKGLDGIFANENGCAHTQGGSIEWFSLELHVPEEITRVQIANRMDGDSSHGENVRITIGPSEVYDPNEPDCLPKINQLFHQPGLQNYRPPTFTSFLNARLRRKIYIPCTRTRRRLERRARAALPVRCDMCSGGRQNLAVLAVMGMGPLPPSLLACDGNVQLS